MPKAKTPDEIEAQITRLQELKPKIKRYNAFGDDHYKTIDIMIRVLRHEISEAEFDDLRGDEYGAASETFEWLEGKEEGKDLADPSEWPMI